MRVPAAVLAGILTVAVAASASAQEIKLPEQHFSFEGPFGSYDRAAASGASRSTRRSAPTATL